MHMHRHINVCCAWEDEKWKRANKRIDKKVRKRDRRQKTTHYAQYTALHT